MAFERSSFGNGVLVGDGGNVTQDVHTLFGTRDADGTVGVNKVEGMKEELIIDFSGDLFNTEPDGLIPFVLPAGAVITAVYMDVEEAFALTGTTPALEVGTAESEATNGFSVTKAQLEDTNSVNLTSALSGTWDGEAPLAANTIVGFALSGTDTPTITGGKARITILFDRINRAPSPALPGGDPLP